MKRFFPNNDAMEIGKRHGNDCQEEKCFIKNMNLIGTYYYWKNWVDWISSKWDKMSQPQKCTFWEKLKS